MQISIALFNNTPRSVMRVKTCVKLVWYDAVRTDSHMRRCGHDAHTSLSRRPARFPTETRRGPEDATRSTSAPQPLLRACVAGCVSA
jgi:hypothetical protein|eukprot:3412124-Prymnesium_polylepis.1